MTPVLPDVRPSGTRYPQSLEDAELAIAALQSKALAAERGRLAAEARLAEAGEQLKLARATGEQQLAAAREDGSLRVGGTVLNSK